MDDYKPRKVFLLPGILVILVCVVILIRITLALLSVDEDSGKVEVDVLIGDVKVDITDEDGNTIVGKSLEFEGIGAMNKLYFAPGDIYCTEGFMVKNVGDFAFNFRMNVNGGEDVDGVKFEDAFDIYLTVDPVNFAAAEQITSYEGTLDVGQSSQVFYLVVRMRTDASDEFQSKKFTGIGFTVFATQIEESE